MRWSLSMLLTPPKFPPDRERKLVGSRGITQSSRRGRTIRIPLWYASAVLRSTNCKDRFFFYFNSCMLFDSQKTNRFYYSLWFVFFETNISYFWKTLILLLFFQFFTSFALNKVFYVSGFVGFSKFSVILTCTGRYSTQRSLEISKERQIFPPSPVHLFQGFRASTLGEGSGQAPIFDWLAMIERVSLEEILGKEQIAASRL